MMQSSFEIFIQILLPSLKITKSEREKITDDPQEFVNLANDCCSTF